MHAQNMNLLSFPSMADIAALFAPVLETFNAAMQRITEGVKRLSAALNRLIESPSFPKLRRLLWPGIARRHGLRPPTRGYWVRRCLCFACRERKGFA